MIYNITGFSAGILKTVHWKINAVYPVILENLVLDLYITDIIRKIGPRPDTLEALRKYGFEVFDYLSILKYTLGVFFVLTVSFIFSFPFAAYFSFLSNFYKKIKE